MKNDAKFCRHVAFATEVTPGLCEIQDIVVWYGKAYYMNYA